VAQAIQPHPSASRSRHASASARNPIRETQYHWPSLRGLDSGGAPRPVPPYPRQHRRPAMAKTKPVLSASSEPCIGSDRQLASGLRENRAFCVGRTAEMPDCGVNLPLHPMPRPNVLVQNRIARQSHSQSGSSCSPSGKCRIKQLNFGSGSEGQT